MRNDYLPKNNVCWQVSVDFYLKQMQKGERLFIEQS